MEDFVESLTRGNPTEVKVLLASVALGLAVCHCTGVMCLQEAREERREERLDAQEELRKELEERQEENDRR